MHSISCSNIRKDTGKNISDYCFICYAVNRLFYISKTKLTLFFVASISARRSLLGKELPVQNACLSVFILQYFSSSALVFVLPSCFLYEDSRRSWFHIYSLYFCQAFLFFHSEFFILASHSEFTLDNSRLQLAITIYTIIHSLFSIAHSEFTPHNSPL